MAAEQLGLEESLISSDANWEHDLGGDSLEFVDFTMNVEKEFNISIPDEQAEKWTTVGEVIKYVEDVKSPVKN